ncbi:MAG TPA: alpha/beta hydrolase [Rectinemataceae bacterium]|nr:alpha/beta hydrolase [Rectinemataceae bacterium]
MAFAARMMMRVLRLIDAKASFSRQLRNPSRRPFTMKGWPGNPALRATREKIEGFDVLSLAPLGPWTRRVVFYHGGAYVLGPTFLHRLAIESLVRQGLAISLVDYPKAPEFDCATTRRVALRAYEEIALADPGVELALLGDSAGGGLALATLQALHDKASAPMPRATVLLSPWVDLSMANPLMADFELRDPILSLEGLRFAAELYAAGTQLRDPGLSPLFGKLESLGDIALYFGTEELLFPDCAILARRLSESAGNRLEVHIGEGMMHDWPLIPFAEGRKALGDIGAFLASGVHG